MKKSEVKIQVATLYKNLLNGMATRHDVKTVFILCRNYNCLDYLGRELEVLLQILTDGN